MGGIAMQPEVGGIRGIGDVLRSPENKAEGYARSLRYELVLLSAFSIGLIVYGLLLLTGIRTTDGSEGLIGGLAVGGGIVGIIGAYATAQGWGAGRPR
jgi:sugar phosphate permease